MSERHYVVLVAPDGELRGVAPKLEAHRPPGLLHLAFSVFLYRADGSTLLQRRAATKYHFPGVWANACCSHPEPGEDLVASACRRVREELGLSVELTAVGSFVYRALCPSSGLVEHELDHVLVGRVEDEPLPDPSEVEATSFVAPRVLTAALAGGARPAELDGAFAPWLAEAFRLAEAGRAGAGVYARERGGASA